MNKNLFIKRTSLNLQKKGEKISELLPEFHLQNKFLQMIPNFILNSGDLCKKMILEILFPADLLTRILVKANSNGTKRWRSIALTTMVILE